MRTSLRWCAPIPCIDAVVTMGRCRHHLSEHLYAARCVALAAMLPRSSAVRAGGDRDRDRAAGAPSAPGISPCAAWLTALIHPPTFAHQSHSPSAQARRNAPRPLVDPRLRAGMQGRRRRCRPPCSAMARSGAGGRVRASAGRDLPPVRMIGPASGPSRPGPPTPDRVPKKKPRARGTPSARLPAH